MEKKTFDDLVAFLKLEVSAQASKKPQKCYF